MPWLACPYGGGGTQCKGLLSQQMASQVGDLFCFVLFALQLSVCLWWHDYRRDDFPTLKFGVVMADLLAIC